jgi:hypothetical protein
MKRLIFLLLLAAFGQLGCSGQFWGGAATGALATGAGYEINASRQMHKLDEDYKDGKIDRTEYESRKRQLEKGSIIY